MIHEVPVTHNTTNFTKKNGNKGLNYFVIH